LTADIWYTEKHENKAGITLKVKDVLYNGESEFQKIDMIDTEAYGRMLLLDGLVMTSEKDEFFYHEMITHIPMLAHKNPESVLVIGGGDGGTVREVLKHPSVKEVVLCEIDGKVIEVSKEFLPTISCGLDDPRVQIHVEDAVKYIQGQKNRFDVILIDSTDPLGPGVGLFTEEFYCNIKAALKHGGIVVPQTESPLACHKDFKLINALLNRVFDIVVPYFAPVPTYPGAYWSWTFCSKDVKPELLNKEFAAELEKTTKFYNTDIHSAVFAVSNYVKEMLNISQRI